MRAESKALVLSLREGKLRARNGCEKIESV
jgi:hypothetical protein